MAATTGGSVNSTNAFATLEGIGDAWRVAETPGPILVANKSTVWAISVDMQAAVPTMGVPEIVATLPEGEEVRSIGYHVGHVVIGTPRGVRFATLDANELVYGPLVSGVEVARSNRFSVRNSSVYLLGTNDDGLAGAYAYDLSQMVEPLVPAWHHAFTTSALSTGKAGSLAINEMEVVAWSESAGEGYETYFGYYATSGSLTTGFHRLGTLDRKHFHEVLVRTKGGGTVQVYRVDADGTETSLGPAFQASDGETVLPLGLSAPVERIALRFVLTRGAASVTPELLGYQIKALPSPKRQRLIRVPLMMFDIERGPTGRAQGAEKSAWTRYQALEVLEETDALVDFEDGDTGETGSAYIESVELIQRNGSKGRARENGFGGVVSVTLRKVS